MAENSSSKGGHAYLENPKVIQHTIMDEIDNLALLKEKHTQSSLEMTNPSLDCEKDTNKSLVTGDEQQFISKLQIRPHKRRLFTAKELSSSITASETTRIICSVLIALLVVLSYIDKPILGINIVHSKSIVALRPLYMLLITEITVLITHLILKRQKTSENEDEEKEAEDFRVLKAAGLNWERAVGILESGLVAHQIVGAFFIDCSVYVVIVVSGFSLV